MIRRLEEEPRAAAGMAAFGGIGGMNGCVEVLENRRESQAHTPSRRLFAIQPRLVCDRVLANYLILNQWLGD